MAEQLPRITRKVTINNKNVEPPLLVAAKQVVNDGRLTADHTDTNPGVLV